VRVSFSKVHLVTAKMGVIRGHQASQRLLGEAKLQ